MAQNTRIFYACQAVAITPRGSSPSSDYIVQGLQSVGMSSSFTLDQVFELGQLELYANIEEVADVEVTLEKVLDGYKTIYNLATQNDCSVSLSSAAKKVCDVWVAVFDDSLDNATGVPRTICANHGMVVGSVSYNYTVDGSATESVTLVGNDRYWNSQDAGDFGTAPDTKWTSDITSTLFDGSDAGPSGVVRRVNFDVAGSTFPPQVELNQANSTSLLLQSVSVSCDFGQENIQELGKYGPYAKYATFPIEVTSEFEVIASSGDLVNVSGSAPSSTGGQIIIKDDAGTVIDLGSNNLLTSVSYSGGDTGGGNVTVTYSYSNFNSLKVTDGGGA